MPNQLLSLTIMDKTDMTPLSRVDNVLGFNLDELHVRVQLGGDVGTMPAEVPLEIMTREPVKSRKGMSSMTNPFTTTASRVGSLGTVYRVKIPQATLAPLIKRRDDLKKVATVSRDQGSDQALSLAAVRFRSLLLNNGWVHRGAAKQAPIGADHVTGDLNDDQPDAKTLLQCRGVEVLEVSVPASSKLVAGPHVNPTWCFIQSPADVLFYSGHGAFWSCELLHEFSEQEGTYEDWLSPEEVFDNWKSPGQLGSNLDPNVLIINGCSVLQNLGDSQPDSRTHHKTADPCVKRWGKLLKTTPAEAGRPLTAILGYRATAPSDAAGGTQIAVSMADAMNKSLGTHWDQYALQWMTINLNFGSPYTRTAAALDRNGYFRINQKMDPGSATHDEWPMPGFDQDLFNTLKGPSIIGPAPVPVPTAAEKSWALK
jgi:hypothetical protein